MSDEHQHLPESTKPETKRYAIREGAGLDESRVNQEFIDALQKYGMWVLLLAALALAAYSGWTRFEQHRNQSRQAAYADLSSAMEAGSPDNLVQLAVTHQGQGAVGILARLQAADLYLAAYRTGLAPGAQLTQDGKPASDADVLNDEQRTEQLNKAEREYRAVYDTSKDDPAYALHTMGSLFGLAAVAESRGKMDEAKNYYSQIVEVSEKSQLPLPGEEAKARIASLDSLGEAPKLYTTDEVLALKPKEPEPQPAPAPEATPTAAPVLTPVNPEDVPGLAPSGEPTEPAPSEPSSETP